MLLELKTDGSVIRSVVAKAVNHITHQPTLSLFLHSIYAFLHLG
jgi:hypothetical protein